MNNAKNWSSVGIIIAIIVILNMLMYNIQIRFDLTENNVYTMSEVTKNTLDQIEDPVLVKVFYSEKFPKQLISLKQYTFDLLDEYKSYAGSRLDYEFVEIGENGKDAKADAQSLGIQPVQANIVENDQKKVQLIYFGIAFLFGDKKEVIPFTQNVSQLEYDVTSSIKKLIHGGKTKLGYLTGFDELSLEKQSQFNPEKNKKPEKVDKVLAVLREQYELIQVDLTKVDIIPSTITVAIWVDPKKEITEQAKFLVDQFLMRGGKLAAYVNNQKIDFENPLPIAPMKNGVGNFLKNYGLEIKDNIVVDKQSGNVQTVQQVGPLRIPVTVKYPFLPIFTNFNKDQAIVSRMTRLSLSFVSSIDSVPGKNANFIPLVQSSDQSGFATKDPRRNMYSHLPKQVFNYNQKKITVAALVVGKFKSAFSMKPDTIKYSGTFSNSASENASILAVGDADFIKDNMASKENLDFFMNTIDWLVDENGLISIRSKKINVKSLDKEIIAETATGTRATLKLINVFLAPLLIIAFGLIRWVIRRKTKQLALHS